MSTPEVKPFAPSCERNRDPILAVLREHLADSRNVLEIGSGTGQHAVYFAGQLPYLQWQCSDQAEHLAGMRMWLTEAALPNTPEPLALDVTQTPWPQPERTFDAAFTANTLHYMPWAAVEALFAGLPRVLAPQARLLTYGPFNYGGQFTSAGNAEFDVWLKNRSPLLGVRDFEAVSDLARLHGLHLIEDVTMPANNRCLIWQFG
jgi:SAM-dependent methyltransferase